MRISSLVGLAVAAPIVAFASNAQASTFTYNTDRVTANIGAGTFENIHTSFDDQSQQFSWSSTFLRPTATWQKGLGSCSMTAPTPRPTSKKTRCFT